MKSLNNFSNNKPNDHHGFIENIKIKFNAVLAVVGKFSNGASLMMELLKAERPALDWAAYCAMPNQIVQEEKGDAVTKAILLLMITPIRTFVLNIHKGKINVSTYSRSNGEIFVNTTSQQEPRSSTQR